ncbi:MAG: hypothetical protein WKH64_09705 [Chloroflexia bacterium]
MTVEEIEAAITPGKTLGESGLLRSADEPLTTLPAFEAAADEAATIRHGREVQVQHNVPIGHLVRAYSNGRMFALLRAEDGVLRAAMLLD